MEYLITYFLFILQLTHRIKYAGSGLILSQRGIYLFND